MSEGFICRNSGDGYATINFNTYTGVVHGSLTSSSRALSEASLGLASTSVGNYALFGGGYNSSGFLSTVNAYNTSLTRTTPTSLSVGRRYLAATNVGDYALFGGGDSGSESNVVDAYNTSLTRTTPTSLSEARLNLAATSVGNYALFGGGTRGVGYFDVVDAYNTNLTRTTPTVLSQGRSVLAATRVEGDKVAGEDYALFGGGAGFNSADSSIVDAYNDGLVHTTPTSLSQERTLLAATSVKTYYSSLSPHGHFYSEYYALFAGGQSGNSFSDAVDAYNTYLTRTTPVPLSEKRGRLSAGRTSCYAFFAGGYGSSNDSSIVDLYDESFLRYSAPNLSEARRAAVATNIGGYVLFGGGYASSNYSSVVDYYTVDNIFQVFPETKYKFSGMSSERTSSTIQEITARPPISGYIKVKSTNIS